MGIITNFTGHPCLSLPCGFQDIATRSPRGLGVPTVTAEDGVPHHVPHALWIWGKLFDEGTLLRLGRALERAFGAAGKRPPGCD